MARRVELLLADARAAVQQGERAEAHALATAILALDPANAEAESLLAGSDQRIQVTIMFCDLAGSTQLADERDPEEVSAILREYRLLCMNSIARYGGFVEERQGDGLLVRFGYPWVHEDDTRRAVLSGLEIIRAIRAHPLGLHVRIAVHTGLVVLDGGEVIGATPNEAARLQGLAEPDTLVISDVTRELVGDFFEVRSLGQATLRGVSRPIGVFAVVSERDRKPFDGAALTPFANRKAELVAFADAWSRTCEGTSTALLVTGPPGIGKSRLAYEGVRSAGAHCLACGCSSYRSTVSLHPFVALLETICEIVAADAPVQRLAKLRRRLGRDSDLPLLTTALAISEDVISPPPDVDPTRLHALALATAAELLRRCAAGGPLVLLVEDLHWADESSLELIAQLLAASHPGLLVVMTARPEFTAPWARVEHIELAPLPRDELERMVLDLAPGRELEASTRNELIARSDGVPLFLEELVRGGAALRGRMASGPHASRIPGTLRDPLLARLTTAGVDLPLVQLAATIGRDVDRELLRAASGLPDKPFQTKLANLVGAGVVDAVSADNVRFRHDLLRDAAYETQRRSARRARHGRIANLLRAEGELTPRQAGSIAFHLERAERHSEAIEALLVAARGDQALGAHKEAIARLTTAVRLADELPTGPERLLHELSARQLRSFSAVMTGGYSGPETAQDHARCVELCEHLGLVPALLPSLILSWSYYIFRGDLAECERVCATMERVIDASGTQSPATDLARGVTGFFAGRLREAHAYMATFGADPWGHVNGDVPSGWPLPNDPLAALLAHDMVATYLLGDAAAAAELGEQALARAARIGFPVGPFTTAYVTTQIALVCMLEGDVNAARRHAGAVASIGDRHGFVLWSLAGRLQQHVAAVRLGDAAALVPLAETMYAWRELLSGELWTPYWLTEIGAAQLAAGDREAARASLDEALGVADVTGVEFYRAETLRVRGELRRQADDEGGLEDLRLAVQIARGQGAVALEQRAAQTLRSRGERQPATP